MPAAITIEGGPSVVKVDGITSLLPVRSSTALWQWPPVAKGHVRTFQIGDRTVTVRTLAMRPALFLVENFLSGVEVKQMMKVIQNSDLEPSTVAGPNNQRMENKEYRISMNAWISHDGTAFQRNITRRLSALTQLPLPLLRGSRDMQAVVYRPGGHYSPHQDSAGDRYVTALYVMQNANIGGETGFPFADEHYPPDGIPKLLSKKWKQLFKNNTCRGIPVQAQVGSAIMWYNHDINPHSGKLGDVVDEAFHAGCPVKDGTKIVANHWVQADLKAQQYFGKYLVAGGQETQRWFLSSKFTKPGHALFVLLHAGQRNMKLLDEVDEIAAQWTEKFEATSTVATPLRFISVDVKVDVNSGFASQACGEIGQVPAACIMVFGKTEMVAKRFNFAGQGDGFDAAKLPTLVQEWQEDLQKVTGQKARRRSRRRKHQGEL